MKKVKFKQLKNIFYKIRNYDYKKYIQNNFVFLIFVIINVVNATILRFFTVGNYFEIKPLLGDLAFSIIIGSFGYIFKPKNQFKYYLAVTIFFAVICIVNSMYYTNYLSYVSFSLLATSMQVIGVSDAVTQNIMELKDFCYLWSVFAIIFTYITLNKKQYYTGLILRNYGKKRVRNTLLGGLAALTIFACTLTPVDIGRITKQWNREYIVTKFGLYIYQFSDFIYNFTFKFTNFFGYDNNLKIFREYYEDNSYQENTNEYTNIFKGKNIIAIHAESIQQFTMGLEFNGKELTPTLNK